MSTDLKLRTMHRCMTPQEMIAAQALAKQKKAKKSKKPKACMTLDRNALAHKNGQDAGEKSAKCCEESAATKKKAPSKIQPLVGLDAPVHPHALVGHPWTYERQQMIAALFCVEEHVPDKTTLIVVRPFAPFSDEPADGEISAAFGNYADSSSPQEKEKMAGPEKPKKKKGVMRRACHKMGKWLK